MRKLVDSNANVANFSTSIKAKNQAGLFQSLRNRGTKLDPS